MSGIINANVNWGNKFKITLKRLLNRPVYTYINKSDSSQIDCKSSDTVYTTIIARKNSKIELGENITCKNTKIVAEENACIKIEDGCNISNTSIIAKENSKIVIKKECIVGSFYSHPTIIYAENANIQVGMRTKLLLERLVAKWGGKLTIGKYSGYGYLTDIRCDEKIELGEFTLCSYNVSIYDSNIHSLDYKVRRENIINQYPGGLTDIEKPDTAPVILGNDIWIGRNASIMKGTELANQSIIGTGAIVAGVKESVKKTFVSQKARVI